MPLDTGATAPAPTDARVTDVVRRVWGFESLRPLQADAIAATLAGRDSLTVLPTGGGKSLCYQVPPLVTGRLTLVVSPLIALMQDQVAGLRLAGVKAAAIHSHTTDAQRAEMRDAVAAGDLRLLLVAPERMILPDFFAWVRRLNIGHLAVDEAHCISQWGHDFRPEYRRLGELRAALPGVPLGAYTATATPRVREDIVRQLRLRDAAVLVGVFDRPNLTYRVLPRVDVVTQTAEALARHPDDAAIIYCISRRDTESLAASLRNKGVDARAYHAGMDGAERASVSDAFRDERLRVVVATVAFGMGIDRGDVRLVVHAAMPKSVEHYQQETGRAGRDGLPAECLLLYSAADHIRWKQLLERSAGEAMAVAGDIDPENFDPTPIDAQYELLEHMHRFAAGGRCRHAALSEYFGQSLAPAPDIPDTPGIPVPRGCAACDTCLGELAAVADAQDTARKIISCVFRCGQTWGAAHIADVLVGKATAKIKERGHDRLSTYALLRGRTREQVISYINQLVDQDLLERELEFSTLRLTGQSMAVLKNERAVSLVEPAVVTTVPRRSKRDAAISEAAALPDLTDAEKAIFEDLRVWRRAEAQARNVPPFVVFADTVLQAVARARPRSLAALRDIKGIGERKLADFGAGLLEVTSKHTGSMTPDLRLGEGPDSSTSVRLARPAPDADDESPSMSASAHRAAELFRQGRSVAEVAQAMGRAVSTVNSYLAEFVREERPGSIDPWVPPDAQHRIMAAAMEQEQPRLKPIFDKLGGTVPYEQIRLTLAHAYGRAAP